MPGSPIDLHRLSEAALQPWSEALLEPFFPEIEAADEIDILPTESLHHVPFHALPWEAGILLDRATVRYGLDVATCGADLAAPRGGALVVQGDDPYFASEASAVAAELAEHWPVAVVRPTRPADLGPLLAGEYAVAHVVAHGEHVELDRLLATDDRLLLGDTLTLPRRTLLAAPGVPALVHLSACRSSFTDAETLGGGISLAHAFLLRGARYVVGAIEDVDGEVARAFASRFHRALAVEGLAGAPEAWREAYLAASGEFSSPSLARQLRRLRLYAR
ncbi:CHAT domain-containing protein [Nannocystis pusilla]|uniref:CHAT domain-containing protein n=1 Tax=Nannocystis pusilla TaxID=889268 RepID=UPI003B791985